MINPKVQETLDAATNGAWDLVLSNLQRYTVVIEAAAYDDNYLLNKAMEAKRWDVVKKLLDFKPVRECIIAMHATEENCVFPIPELIALFQHDQYKLLTPLIKSEEIRTYCGDGDDEQLLFYALNFKNENADQEQLVLELLKIDVVTDNFIYTLQTQHNFDINMLIRRLLKHNQLEIIKQLLSIDAILNHRGLSLGTVTRMLLQDNQTQIFNELFTMEKLRNHHSGHILLLGDALRDGKWDAVNHLLTIQAVLDKTTASTRDLIALHIINGNIKYSQQILLTVCKDDMDPNHKSFNILFNGALQTKNMKLIEDILNIPNTADKLAKFRLSGVETLFIEQGRKDLFNKLYELLGEKREEVDKNTQELIREFVDEYSQYLQKEEPPVELSKDAQIRLTQNFKVALGVLLPDVAHQKSAMHKIIRLLHDSEMPPEFYNLHSKTKNQIHAKTADQIQKVLRENCRDIIFKKPGDFTIKTGR